MSIRYRLVSVLAGKASGYIGIKKLSEIIPFRGKFPMVDDVDMQEYQKAIRSTEMIEDLPEKWQRVVINGARIFDFEESFREYLSEYGLSIDNFLELKNTEKSDKLVDWMERNCISLEMLKLS